jgi:hypothetical protein
MRHRRVALAGITVRIAASLCSAAILVAVCSSPASAATARLFLRSFGSFSSVAGVAVDQTNEDVYVYDGGNEAIYKFDALGNPVDFASTGTNEITGVPSATGSEAEIAVDDSAGPAKGDIYVAHASYANVLVYNEAGEQAGEITEAGGHPWGEACGVAVGSSGAVYVGLYPDDVDKYVPTSAVVTDSDYAGSYEGVDNVCNVAVDPAGNLLVDSWSSGPVTGFAPSQLGAALAAGSVIDENGTTLAVDPATEDVFVDEQSQVSEFGPNGTPYNEPLLVFGASGTGALDGYSTGIAVNEHSNEVYVSDGTGQIDIFGPAVAVAGVSTEAASAVTPTSATLNGTVNPEGIPVSACEFEYGSKAGAFTNTIPCSPPPGGGTNPVPVSAALTGLTPGASYHYRLAATDANGTNDGQEEVFKFSPTTPAGPTGLPDGRVYEQVSPAFKNGNYYDLADGLTFGLASSNGNSVVYVMTGPVGESYAGLAGEFVSTRSPEGWQTHSATPPRPTRVDEFLFDAPGSMIPSASFNKFLFDSSLPWVAEDPRYSEGESGVNIFLSESPTGEALWLGRPTAVEPLPRPGDVEQTAYAITGQSPELTKVYFAYRGTLTPQDASRVPYAKLGGAQFPGTVASREDTPWGFYEWDEGKLESAGELPDGSFNAFGAAPASFAAISSSGGIDSERSRAPHYPQSIENQVSEDGERAFFVSPDPAASSVTNPTACTAEPPCSAEPPELYAREPGPAGTRKSVLISRSELPGHEGEAAPDGAISIPGTYANSFGSYAYPSSDGTRVFFASTDRLTSEAPANTATKVYEYNLETGELTYLPEISGAIAAVSRDGSEVLFENTAQTPATLELWRSGSDAGSVTEIAALPGSGQVDSTHFSGEGMTLIFRTPAEVTGEFNNGGGFDEIYRYEVGTGSLDCVSCAPQGSQPLGDARMSYNNPETQHGGGSAGSTIETRGMSEDAGRIFFDTPNALVPQDVNGVRDVYEWEGGTDYLISSGTGDKESAYLDNDATGENVFFATSQGLLPGDTDEAYDIYDARIPRPGDNAPPTAIPCKGSICQGPPSTPQLLSPPASETFDGPGDLAPTKPTGSPPKGTTSKQKLQKALSACKRRFHNRRKRTECNRRARKRYGAGAARAGKASRMHGARHHNGRGKWWSARRQRGGCGVR